MSRVGELIPNSGHTLSVAAGGSVLETFYQPCPYYSGRDLFVLSPIPAMSVKEMLAYTVLIRCNKYRYNYGRQANRTLEDMQIPSLEDVRKLVVKHSIPDEPSIKPFHRTHISLSDRSWKLFRYDELFDLKKGRRLTKAQMTVGVTPFVAPINSNNGHRQYISVPANHRGNTITVSYNGSVGEAFYQPIPYFASDDVNVLYPKFELNPYTGMFLCSLIRREKYRYNYGRKWRIERMNASTILLPLDKRGKPDWKFMEKYIKSLPCSSSL